jgi:hypothetical protein
MCRYVIALSTELVVSYLLLNNAELQPLQCSEFILSLPVHTRELTLKVRSYNSLFSDSHWQAGEHSPSDGVVDLLTSFPFSQNEYFLWQCFIVPKLMSNLYEGCNYSRGHLR